MGFDASVLLSEKWSHCIRMDHAPLSLSQNSTNIMYEYNTEVYLLKNYREHRAEDNPTGMGCVHLYSDGHVVAGANAISRFKDYEAGKQALIEAGFRAGDLDCNTPHVFYV